MQSAQNLLGLEQSPYLLQHADNPVHWRSWGMAALAEAQRLNRPVLLSIGYAACHWCHVMAHESFENADTAALMNRFYVNIKVDREERPDIDHIYMSALHALGEQGGWPLTMFLTPEGEPFWGGTYFPPEPRWGRPSFRQVLQGVADAWSSGDVALLGNAQALRHALSSVAQASPGKAITPSDLDQAARSLLASCDPVHGGLGGAPKFPNPPVFRFLWQEYARTGERSYAEAVRLLLRAMSQGGIYDHLGGGYARYSTDAEWLVPHFEKMLYDNAQILELLALVAAERPDPLLAARAEETVGWLLRDMTAERGPDGNAAFAASEDADSEGEEGRFYVWTEEEIDALLGPNGAAFRSAYDIRPGGNWEGRTILRRLAPLGDPAMDETLARCRSVLFNNRQQRMRPGRDDKVLADWNGLAISALCRAGAVFERPDWVARAGEAFDFLRATMAGTDGRTFHALRRGKVTAAGLLDDHAALARAALALFEATGEPRRLDQARDYARTALQWFADTDGSFFTTASDAADVPTARPRNASDSATPSGNGLMAEVLARLYHLTGDAAWRAHAQEVLQAFSGAGRTLAGMPTLLAAADLLQNAATVVVAGSAQDPSVRALARVAVTAPDPAV
ncbi:MAG: thioredoxin domain-containing protein, partial [Pseudomonadota bacterium]|nr:thioredoxin domain-containing protein [Pseudomonadota bacterium]